MAQNKARQQQRKQKQAQKRKQQQKLKQRKQFHQRQQEKRAELKEKADLFEKYYQAYKDEVDADDAEFEDEDLAEPAAQVTKQKKADAFKTQEEAFALLDKLSDLHDKVQSTSFDGLKEHMRQNFEEMSYLFFRQPCEVVIGLRNKEFSCSSILHELLPDRRIKLYEAPDLNYALGCCSDGSLFTIAAIPADDPELELPDSLVAEMEGVAAVLRIQTISDDEEYDLIANRFEQLEMAAQICQVIDRHYSICWINCLRRFTPAEMLDAIRSPVSLQNALNLFFETKTHDNPDGSICVWTDCMWYFGVPELQIKRTQSQLTGPWAFYSSCSLPLCSTAWS